MAGALQTIARLARHELTSPAYRQLTAERFGTGNWEAQVRYARWLFDDNPASQRNEPLPIFVCRHGDQMVGQVGVIPVEVRVNGTSMRGGWCVDLFVLPEYQRRRVGESLLTAVQRDFPLSLTLGQSDAGYSLVRRLGWRVAASLTRYRRLLRPLSGVAKKAMEKAGLARLASAVNRGSTGRAIRAVPDLQIEPILSFAHSVDRHRDLRGAAGAPTRISRTPAFMQWRYCDHPLFRYTVRHLTIAGHGDAYAVWRLVDDGLWRRGSLVDLVYPDGLPQPLLAPITALVTDCIRADGAEIVDCQTSDAAVLAALAKQPFSRTEPGMRFLYRLDAGAAAINGSADLGQLYAGDGDADTHMARDIQP